MSINARRGGRLHLAAIFVRPHVGGRFAARLAIEWLAQWDWEREAVQSISEWMQEAR